MIRQMKNIRDSIANTNACTKLCYLNLVPSSGHIGSKSFTKRLFEAFPKISSSLVRDANCHKYSTRECWDIYFKALNSIVNEYQRIGRKAKMFVNHDVNIFNYFFSLDTKDGRKREFDFDYSKFIKFLKKYAENNTELHSPHYSLLVSRKNIEENGGSWEVVMFFLNKYFGEGTESNCIIIS